MDDEQIEEATVQEHVIEEESIQPEPEPDPLPDNPTGGQDIY
jgi:hypothetical protein